MSNESLRPNRVKFGEFPFPLTDGQDESRYLAWLRNHSNYMAERGFLDYLRSVAVLVRGILINFLIFVPVLLIIALALGRAHDWMHDHPFLVTRCVLLLAVIWILLFLLIIPLFKIVRYKKSLETGSDSSVKVRDRYERSFGGFVLAILAFAVAESLPYVVDFFHKFSSNQLVWQEIFSLAAVLTALSGANKVLSVLGGAAKKVAMVLIGILGLLVPLLFVLYVTDFLLYGRIPEANTFQLLLLVPALGVVGILVAFLVGLWQRAFGLKEAFQLFGLLVVGVVLLVTVGMLVTKAAGQPPELTNRREVFAGDLDVLANELDELESRGSAELKRKLTELRKVLNKVKTQGKYLPLVVATRPEEEYTRNYEQHVDEVEEALAAFDEVLNNRQIREEFRQELRSLAQREWYVDVACAFLRLDKQTQRNWPEFAQTAKEVISSPPETPERIASVGVQLAQLRDQLERSPEDAEELSALLRRDDPAALARQKFGELASLDPGEGIRELAQLGYPPKALFVFTLAVVTWLFCWMTVDVNLTSIHGLYRDRLASAFLVGEDTNGDVDIEQDLDLLDICCYEAGSTAPYHLVNVALNLQGSNDIGIRDRNSDFFIFSKRFIGGHRTGYCRSRTMEQVYPQIGLSTAMAISAAAASPNMGRETNPALVALMTMLNVRLGFWIPNPGMLEEKLAGRGRKQKRVSVASKQPPGFTFEEVFAKELNEEIEPRRNRAYGDDWQKVRPLISRSSGPLLTTGYELAGIGFSGGGIRSATINLGIAQALHKRGVFQHLDYMSTVSGGGYLGSSISTLMRCQTRQSSEIAGTVKIKKLDTGEQIVRVSGDKVEQQEYRFELTDEVLVSEGQAVEAGDALIGRLSGIKGKVALDEAKRIIRVTGSMQREYQLAEATIKVKSNVVVTAGQVLAERSTEGRAYTIKSEIGGKVTVEKGTEQEEGKHIIRVTSTERETQTYHYPLHAQLVVKAGKIKKNEVLFEYPKQSQIFGTVSIEITDAEQIVRVRGAQMREYKYEKGAELNVKTGDTVKAGDRLVRRKGPRLRTDMAGHIKVEADEAGEKIVSVSGTPCLPKYSRYDVLDVKSGDWVEPGGWLLKRWNSLGERFRWRVRPIAFLREMLGWLDEKYAWVNLSDGGHIENLATIELLRRRCKYIIIGDGEADPKHHFKGLATLIRCARIDLGIHIDIDLTELRLIKKSDKHKEDDKGTVSRDHWAIGKISYPEKDDKGEHETGYLLYLKSSFTDDEDEVIQEYRHRNPDFPHQSTADQFFDEGQFEAYRALGQHIAEVALNKAAGDLKVEDEMTFANLKDWFDTAWKVEGKRREGK